MSDPFKIRPPATLAPDRMADVLSGHLAYLDSLAMATISAHESARLGPYFYALENRLNDKKKETATPLEKGALKNLFNKISHDTGNVLLSEFMILPQHTAKIPANVKTFFSSTHHSGTVTSIGFLQMARTDETGSISIPTILIDADISRRLSTVDTADLLSHLGTIMSAGNHDMMHHFTNSFLNSNIASTQDVNHELNAFLSSATGSNRDDDPRSYESWALLSHADTWNTIKKTNGGQDLQTAVDGLYDALDILNPAMKNAEIDAEDRQKIRHYFSTLALFFLVRSHPMTDPVVKHAMDRSDGHALPVGPTIAKLRESPLFLQRDILKLSAPVCETAIEALFADIADGDPGFIKNAAKNIRDAVFSCKEKFGTRMPVKIDISRLEQAIKFDVQKQILGELNTIHTAIKKTMAGAWNDSEGVASNENRTSFIRKIFFDLSGNENNAGAKIAPDVPDYMRAAMADAIIKTTPHMKDQSLATYSAFTSHYTRAILQTLRDTPAPQQKENRFPQNQKEFVARITENYAPAGLDILDLENLPQTLRRIQLILLAPEITYLASPADNDIALSPIKNRSGVMDRTIINILTGKQTLPQQLIQRMSFVHHDIPVIRR